MNFATGLGLGLGLFGVLSIIRLRSSEPSQEEVAYYFVALAMGSSRASIPTRRGSARARPDLWRHVRRGPPAAASHYRRQVVTLDAGYTNEPN